jgi:hypothetical protein
MTSMSSPRPRSTRRRWRRRFCILLTLGVLVFLLRVPLLRSAGQSLVADDGFVPCSHVTLLQGDRRYDAAAGLVAAGYVRDVLLFESEPTRIQALGLVPTNAAIDRRELSWRGVPAEQMTVVPGQARTVWDWARQLGAWLADHPGATVLVLTDRFSSRHDRQVVRRSLTAEQFRRVHLAALPHRDYQEHGWWREKGGGLAFGYGVLHLGYVVLAGEGESAGPLASADELESSMP